MNNNKQGVLVLTPFYEPNIGGVETHLKDLTEYLKTKDTCKAYVLTYQPITTKARGKYIEKNKNVTIFRIPWIGFNLFHKLEPFPVLEFLYITPWLFLWTFIFLLFNGHNIKTIHTQGFNASFITRILKNIFKKRFVVSTHAVYDMDQNSFTAKMVKWTLLGADKILTLSNASKKQLETFGVKKESIDTYTYWVDQEIFKPMEKEAAKKEIGLQKQFVVLFVGRLIEIKGIRILIESAKNINEDICFAFAGDGPMAETLKQESKNNKNIEFLGRINNSKLPTYYSAADILCVPSEYEEGFGRVIIEALSCGTPVIGSNKGGIPEAIDDTVGCLVKANVDDFSTAILDLYKNKDKLKIKTMTCRDYAVKKFGTKNALTIFNSYDL